VGRCEDQSLYPKMSDRNPPRIAERLFNWYCGSAGVDDLRGDMEEVFHRNVNEFSYRKAKNIYWRQVLSLIFSYTIRKRKSNSSYNNLSSSNPFDMWANYFKVGLRNLYRHRYFTILNMVGLAIGMSVSLLIITLFVSVTNYDEFHVNKKTIYRVLSYTNTGKEYASAPPVLGERLKAEYPGIKEVIHIDRNLYISEPLPKTPVFTTGFYVDPSFLSSFTFPLAQGDAKTALAEPHSIVLTEKQAKKIFGETNAMGKFVFVNNVQYEVTGIMKDFPLACHLEFNAIAPYSAISKDQLNLPVKEAWSEFRDHYIYLQLKEGQDPAKLQAYLDKISAEVYKSNPDFKADFRLQALGDITPGPDLDNDIGPEWSYLSFVIAGCVGLLILLPACFNYTNISIARALKRAKEIGLRKTLGGLRRQIFAQFIAETVLVTVGSLILSCALFMVLRGEFQAMMTYGASLDLSLTVDRFLYFLAFAIFTGFMAGLFPAMHFSRLNPIDAIKNNIPSKRFSGTRIRKALIVFQFGLCLFFILTLVIYNKQYRYAMNFDLGFGEENILDVDLYHAKPDVVSNEFSKLPFVQKVSFSSGVMGHGVPATWASLDNSKDSLEVFYMFVDGNFIENMEVPLLAGKTFENGDSKNGETSVIINQTLMKRFNFAGPSEAIGQIVQVDSLSLKVIGVIKDFHFWQLHAPPGNFFFRNKPDEFRLANVKMATNDVQLAMEEMDKTWRKFSNGDVFTAKFLSDETAGAFYQYRTMLKLFGFLGMLAISISCLGLLGMVVYTAESKAKEVGIRKVMGASRWSIAYLLSKEFLKLMLIASLFALPITLLLDKMLQGMEHYRVAITFLDIFTGLFAMFALGIATMASQTWRTASINPAETLKYE
jgi:putative ABC transport system permease protein